MPKPRILLVDDDADFRVAIKVLLMNEGLQVEEAASAQEMDTVLSHFNADIVLLDVKLPDDSGLNIVSRLKLNRRIDVVMISALGAVEHRVLGLSSGADYYLAKPIDIRELLAVINNRFRALMADKPEQKHSWQLDIVNWLLITPDGEQHTLNNSELKILTLLVEHSMQGKATTREVLHYALGKSSYPTDSRSVDLHISRIRQRFTSNDFQFPIKTIRKVGYQLTKQITIL
ncbi:response regulator transcription factor [Methylophaga sulfidovorans]|uniref:Two-component system, OmpR family, response regulator n=1 Tax=Methylophaga sulfidovorans TaxID=45496 RepID=A0A1I4AL53_9GAMM|nr:response regulator transcription factor [Methylophaga sulfidovorans]SFK57215.1 two-component system, OmpR family, response regulator [Methylophaga sulfidovorans]